MNRLKGKNILVAIPKDYYSEEELTPCLDRLRGEEPERIIIASSKFKEAVGMKNGRLMPDRLMVDTVEGITGDSFVTSAGRGTRQIKGVFHGVLVAGGRGAKKYLWGDRILNMILADRARNGAVLAAIGLGVPCLASANVIDTLEVAAPDDAEGRQLIEQANALVTEEAFKISGKIITARDAAAAPALAEAFIEAVSRTEIKK